MTTRDMGVAAKFRRLIRGKYVEVTPEQPDATTTAIKPSSQQKAA